MPPSSKLGRNPRRGDRSSGGGRRGCGDSWKGGASGANCRGGTIEGGGQRRERKEESPEEQAAKSSYNYWRRLIKNPPVPNDTKTMERVWDGALRILNDDNRGWKQQLIFDLESDEYQGRAHVKNLMEMQALLGGPSTFVGLADPFLLVITHPAILDCLAVDTAVGGIFNFISGSHGSRAIPFFRRICSNLLDHHLNMGSEPDSSLEQLLVALPKAIHELLRREYRASFNDDLPDMLNSIEEMMSAVYADKQSTAFQYVANKVEELRKIVARSRGLLHEEVPAEGGVTTDMVTLTYPRAVQLLGERHDNDKVDISKINIIPTENEIRCNRPEYLPSTNLYLPHFLSDQAQRHLDTHFRLLRHDIFGELKGALGGLLLAAEQDISLFENPRLNLGNIRAYAYLNVHIRNLSFDHNRGLEVQLSFPQPTAARKKSKAQRHRWWEDSKRLEEGVFLSLLSFQGDKSSLLFFNVTGKETNPDKVASLSSHNYLANIIAKLASNNRDDLDTMVRLNCQRSSGILIELPSIIIATFVPVLESIQDMYRLCRLPFRQWIIPDRLGHQVNNPAPLDIPPPMYA
ncbi:hypothetical protein IFR05_013744 [Cadophora sp. M221]|nr:hypothetical protein IFR05_013744 [Cadophora sp. M221]